MSYESAAALRTALEQRLLNQSRATNIALDRLRRRVVFERILARLAVAEPGRWVLKGGMALEVRLDTDARVTKDIDLGLRDEEIDADVLHNRLIDALSADPHGDRFELAAAMPELLTPDSPGGATWRVKVDARLAGKTFGRVKLDIAPRPHELDQTDELELPNALAFAGIPPTTAEVVDLHRHVAEKFHAMLRTFGERENSRVRDLYDVALLIEHDLLQPTQLAEAAERVWSERDGTAPPSDLPTFPASWPQRFESLADAESLDISFATAEESARLLWRRLFPTEEP